MATDMKNEDVQSQISAAVLKQIQRQQEMQAAGLIQMINNSTSLSGTGKIIDRSA